MKLHNFYKCFGELSYYKGRPKWILSKSKPSMMVLGMHSFRVFYKICDQI